MKYVKFWILWITHNELLKITFSKGKKCHRWVFASFELEWNFFLLAWWILISPRKDLGKLNLLSLPFLSAFHFLSSTGREYREYTTNYSSKFTLLYSFFTVFIRHPLQSVAEDFNYLIELTIFYKNIYLKCTSLWGLINWLHLWN